MTKTEDYGTLVDRNGLAPIRTDDALALEHVVSNVMAQDRQSSIAVAIKQSGIDTVLGLFDMVRCCSASTLQLSQDEAGLIEGYTEFSRHHHVPGSPIENAYWFSLDPVDFRAYIRAFHPKLEQVLGPPNALAHIVHNVMRQKAGSPLAMAILQANVWNVEALFAKIECHGTTPLMYGDPYGQQQTLPLGTVVMLQSFVSYRQYRLQVQGKPDDSASWASVDPSDFDDFRSLARTCRDELFRSHSNSISSVDVFKDADAGVTARVATTSGTQADINTVVRTDSTRQPTAVLRAEASSPPIMMDDLRISNGSHALVRTHGEEFMQHGATSDVAFYGAKLQEHYSSSSPGTKVVSASTAVVPALAALQQSRTVRMVDKLVGDDGCPQQPRTIQPGVVTSVDDDRDSQGVRFDKLVDDDRKSVDDDDESQGTRFDKLVDDDRLLSRTVLRLLAKLAGDERGPYWCAFNTSNQSSRTILIDTLADDDPHTYGSSNTVWDPGRASRLHPAASATASEVRRSVVVPPTMTRVPAFVAINRETGTKVTTSLATDTKRRSSKGRASELVGTSTVLSGSLQKGAESKNPLCCVDYSTLQP